MGGVTLVLGKLGGGARRRSNWKCRIKVLQMGPAENVSLPTKEELQTPRTVQEFLPWVVERLRRLGETKEGKSALRLGRGLAKELAEEALAVGMFAAKHFDESPQVLIQYLVGSQPYDAVVTGGSQIKYVEVTQAHEGRNAYLRMLYLEKHGHVSPIGEVIEDDGAVHVESCAKPHDEIRAEVFGRIVEAVRRKADKTYPNDTALVIAFEDFMAVQDEEDEAALDTLVRHRVIPLIGRFRLLALAGWSNRVFREYDPK